MCGVCGGVVSSLYLVVVACSRLLVPGPQRLKLGVQDVQELLDETHGRADVPGLNPTPRVVHQLHGYITSILSALYLHRNTSPGGSGGGVQWISWNLFTAETQEIRFQYLLSDLPGDAPLRLFIISLTCIVANKS